jgi:sialic acid synthase SpsE
MYSAQAEIDIQGKLIGEGRPSYFIADIAANHDGDLGRARDLIFRAKDAGADAAKFQHFNAATIVSQSGFSKLENLKSHQSNWNKTVFDVYKDATVSIEWTESLKEACSEAEITFFTSPYDFEIVDYIDSHVPAYKIGSGDITWLEIIKKIANKNKPYILATGASTMDDVYRAVVAGLEINPQIALLQCNTNYTGSVENMHYIQLNVLKSYRAMFPTMVLGLSDHTPGHATVLGAVALGARIIEKHFTDDVTRIGPDHAFSMDPHSWREMVLRTRELEAALGAGVKKIEQNERETAVIQRRAVRATRKLDVGQVLKESDLCVLRPCPEGAVLPYQLKTILGRKLKVSKDFGDHFTERDFE